MEDTFPIPKSEEYPLAWGDLTTKMDEESPSLGKRSSKNAEELASYLTEYGIRMLIRGHQDRANLSLVYKDGEKPSEELQSESAGSRKEEAGKWSLETIWSLKTSAKKRTGTLTQPLCSG